MTTMTLLDWFEVRQEFLTEQANSGISQQKFLKSKGLNVNTGRKKLAEIGKMAADMSPEQVRMACEVKSIGKGDPVAPKADPKPKRGSASSAPGSGSGKKTAKSENRTKSKGSTEANPRKKHDPTPYTQAADKRITTPTIQRLRDLSSEQQAANGGRFQKGNKAAVKTGRFMSLVDAPPEILEAVGLGQLGDCQEIIQLEEVRYLQMTMLLQERVRKVQTCKDHELPLDDNGKPMSRDEIMRQMLWGASPCLSSMAANITMAHTNAAKANTEIGIKLAKQAKERFEQETIQAVMQAREQDDDGNWNISALEAVRQIEAYGIKPPPLLIQEALQEISLMAPKVDNSGMTDEELEALALEYMETATSQYGTLTERARNMDRILAEAKMMADAASDLEEEDFESGAYTGIEHLDGDTIEYDDDEEEPEDPEADDFWGTDD